MKSLSSPACREGCFIVWALGENENTCAELEATVAATRETRARIARSTAHTAQLEEEIRQSRVDAVVSGDLSEAEFHALETADAHFKEGLHAIPPDLLTPVADPLPPQEEDSNAPRLRDYSFRASDPEAEQECERATANIVRTRKVIDGFVSALEESGCLGLTEPLWKEVQSADGTSVTIPRVNCPQDSILEQYNAAVNNHFLIPYDVE